MGKDDVKHVGTNVLKQRTYYKLNQLITMYIWGCNSALIDYADGISLFCWNAHHSMQFHSREVQLKTKSGVRLANEAMHALKQLSMLPDAEMGLETRQDLAKFQGKVE